MSGKHFLRRSEKCWEYQKETLYTVYNSCPSQFLLTYSHALSLIWLCCFWRNSGLTLLLHCLLSLLFYLQLLTSKLLASFLRILLSCPRSIEDSLASRSVYLFLFEYYFYIYFLSYACIALLSPFFFFFRRCFCMYKVQQASPAKHCDSLGIFCLIILWFFQSGISMVQCGKDFWAKLKSHSLKDIPPST